VIISKFATWRKIEKKKRGQQESGILFLVNSFGEGKRQGESYKGGFNFFYKKGPKLTSFKGI